MQKIAVGQVMPGSVAAQDIFNTNGVMLVPKGTVLREYYIERIKKDFIDEIFVEEYEQDENKLIELYKAAPHIDDIIYEKTCIHAKKQIKKAMFRMNTFGRLNVDTINTVVYDIIEQLLSKKDIILTLSRLRSVDDYTYEHSVNVCVVSLIMGMDYGLDEMALKNLGVGAILHDVGKVGVSEEILKSPSKLTTAQFDEVKTHTEYGYQILMYSEVPEEAAEIALYHHERYDGTGYNRGMGGKDIPLLSRIVTLADAYDAMSNDRVYKKKLPPDKVYREIATLGGIHFDYDIAARFLSRLDLYPVGTGVLLSTGHKGMVIGQNKLLPQSPAVRIFRKDSATGMPSYVDLNLARTTAVFIVDTF